MSAELNLRALAKINLDLRVLYRRPDGYHELRTVFQTISLADRIRVRYEPAPELSIFIDGSVEIEDNLIARAARLVSDELQFGGTFHFRLEKRIPMGAGLGGGSSDAAAILMGLPGMMGRSITPRRLHEMAVSLGSDVPFFLHGGTALGLGRGEEVYPLPDLPSLPGLLLSPEIHVSTAEAYRALSASLPAGSDGQKRAEFGQFAWSEDLASAQNDFEGPVFDLHPELAAIRETLAQAGALTARMTGSGSSVFGLFRNCSELKRTEALFPHHRSVAFSLIGRLRYRRLWARVTGGE